MRPDKHVKEYIAMDLNTQLLTRKAAAEYLGIKENTLAVWATTKRYALPYVKVGRLVKYKRDDLEQFIIENRFSGGSSDAR